MPSTIPLWGTTGRGSDGTVAICSKFGSVISYCLQALITSRNRATAATYLRGRSDWVAWQDAAAARFTSRTAVAVGRVSLGLSQATIALCVAKFEATSFGQRSFNLSEAISDPATITVGEALSGRSESFRRAHSASLAASILTALVPHADQPEDIG